MKKLISVMMLLLATSAFADGRLGTVVKVDNSQAVHHKHRYHKSVAIKLPLTGKPSEVALTPVADSTNQPSQGFFNADLQSCILHRPGMMLMARVHANMENSFPGMKKYQ